MTAATTERPAPAGPNASLSDAGPNGARPGADGQAARLTLRALVASLLGALPLLQLFTDSGWLVQVWISMAIVILPAALLRLQRPPSAFQLIPGVVLLVGYLTRVYLADHAWLGVVPTRASWTDFRTISHAVSSTIRDSSAPLHSTAPVRLYLSLGLVLLAIVLDVLVVVVQRPALGGVPLLLVFTLSGAVPRNPVNWIWFALAGGGYLLILSSRSTEDLRTWGRVVSRPERPARSRLSTALSGRRIAVVAILIAVLVPFVLPLGSVNVLANALHNGRVGTSGNGKGSTGVVIDPLATLRGELTRSNPVNLFSVSVTGAEAKSAFYLRSAVLENYNGKAWVQGQEQDIEPTNGQLTMAPPLLGPSVATSPFKATITVSRLAGTAPVFATPTQLTAVPGNWSWNTRYGVVSGTVKSGQTYSETVAQPNPSIETLESSPAVGRVNFGTGSSVLQENLVINNPPQVVTNLVATITSGKTTPYDKARALSTYFTDPANGFVYSLATKGGESGSDLVDFLTTGKAGFCQQYAAALGVMLRVAGIPARVVLGYSHPPPNANGVFEVTSDDAHAWVEAYFNGIGWVPFDPTPLTGADAARAVALPWAPHPASDTATAVGAPREPGVDPNAAGLGDINAATSGSNGSNDSTGVAPAWLGLMIGGGLLLIALATPATLRVRRRRERLRAAREHGPDPLWTELADTARDLGLGWSNARSVRQTVAWLGELVQTDEARDGLQSLGASVERGRYAATSGRSGRVESADLDGFVSTLKRMRRELRAHVGPKARWRARLLPSSQWQSASKNAASTNGVEAITVGTPRR